VQCWLGGRQGLRFVDELGRSCVYIATPGELGPWALLDSSTCIAWTDWQSDLSTSHIHISELNPVQCVAVRQWLGICSVGDRTSANQVVVCVAHSSSHALHHAHVNITTCLLYHRPPVVPERTRSSVRAMPW
jgi:hypothetical protein